MILPRPQACRSNDFSGSFENSPTADRAKPKRRIAPDITFICGKTRPTSFEPLAPPNELFFRLGIAYPQRARIEGHDVGAIRYCEFSTGAFVEPITVWDEPKRLAFDVVAQPEPLRELSPYPFVYSDHLEGSFTSERGEFVLHRTPKGGTILEGSTWYQLSLFPEPYWTLWSDYLIGAIHMRVLRHVKTTVEKS